MDTSSTWWQVFSLFIVGLGYFSGLTFIFGLLWRIYGYLRVPMPWPEVTTPAPTTEAGALARILGDVTLFPSLFKADKFLWAGAWVFHIALGLILYRHLRYFTYPVPASVLWLESIALVVAYIFGVATLYLFWRRLALPRTLYLSGLPDYFALVLVGLIAGTGMLVSYWAHVSIVDVKAFILGILTLRPVAPPAHPLFLLHFTLVSVLLLYFPFSKLLHAGGIFLSPSRNQPYQVQTPGKRYVNAWDEK